MKQLQPLLRVVLFSLSLFCGTALYARFDCTNTPFYCTNNSQENLVPNSGFECYSSCPNSTSQVNLATPWFQPTGGTPDYFNGCAAISTGVSVPDNFAGVQAAHGGQAYAGGIVLNDGGNGVGDSLNYKEYIEVQLLSPLAPGHTYTVSFYACLADTSGAAITNLGAYLSVNALVAPYSLSNLPVTPQVQNPAGNFILGNWTLIQGTYTAAGGESYITIGNFYDDANTWYTNLNNNEGIGAYYYFDDVAVVDTSACANTCSNGCIALSNPNDIVVSTCSNSLPVNYVVGVTDSCCSNCVTLNSVPPSGSTFPLGTTLVTSTASDAQGTLVSCSFTVTVLHTNTMQFQCPSDITVASCTNIQLFYAPTVTNIFCSGCNDWTVTCNPTNGSYFAPGTTNLVQCVATDGCGDSNSCSFTVTVIQCGCVAAPTNLVLWLPFDETSGSISTNLAAPAYDGAQINNPTPVIGAYVDNSLGFNGANQYVTVPDYSAIEIGTNDFTIDAWIKDVAGPMGPPLGVILAKFNTSPQVGYALSISNSARLTLTMSGNSYLDTGPNILPPDGQWHFVAVSVSQSASQASFYMDGALNSTVPVTPTDVANTSSLWVANWPLSGSGHWWGDLDEVEVFDRALASNELAAIYYAGTYGKCKPSCIGPITINCPSNIVVTSCTNVPVCYNVTATNACGSNLTVVCTPPSCSTFATNSTTTVNCLATDCCGNSNNCSFTVTVVPCAQQTVGQISIVSVSTSNFVVLNWSNTSPYNWHLQGSTNIINWSNFATNVVSPFIMHPTGAAQFYRLMGTSTN